MSTVDSLNPETRLFIQQYGEVARLSLDIFRTEDEYDLDKYIDSSSIDENLIHPLDEVVSLEESLLAPESFESTYYSFLYVERPKLRNTLLRKLENSNHNTVCFVGPPRSGKTSLTRRICRELKKRKDTYCLYFDLRPIIQETEGETIISALASRIRSQYRSAFFDLSLELPDGRNSYIALLAFVLSKVLKGGTWAKFSDYRNDLLALGRNSVTYKKSTGTDTDRFYQWIDKDGLVDKEARGIFREIFANLHLRHYAFAVRHLYGISNHILFFDNIDQLDRNQQVELYRQTHSLHGQTVDLIKFCITVRDEHVRNYITEREQEHNAPPYSTRIRIDVRPKKGGVVFPTCELAAARPEELTSIVNKRLDMTSMLLDQKRRTLQKNKGSLESQENKKLLSLLSKASSKNHLDSITRLSNRMLRAMNEDSLICLTNGSIKDFLLLHGDFLTRLLREKDRNTGEILADKYPPWALKTLFYRHFRESARDSRFGLPNIFQEVRNWENRKNGEEQWVGCTLKYLIITTTWGLERNNERPRSRYPLLGRVYDAIMKLGFTEETVQIWLKNALEDLTIEYRNPRNRLCEELLLDEPVLASLRGKTLVSYTIPSFGYLFQCYREVNSQGDQSVFTNPNIAIATQLMANDLCRLGDMHLWTLLNMRNDTSFAGAPKFVMHYKDNYGRPDNFHPYEATPRTARFSKILLFETIMERLIAYVQTDSYSHKFFRRLYDEFKKDLAAINRGEELPGIPLAERLAKTIKEH